MITNRTLADYAEALVLAERRKDRCPALLPLKAPAVELVRLLFGKVAPS